MVRRWMSATVAALLLAGSMTPVAAATTLTPQPPAPQAESGAIVDATPPAEPGEPPESADPTVPGNPVEPAEEPAPLFTDLPEDHWAYLAVKRLLEAGVIAPSPTGTFRPDDLISRAELLKMILAARQIDPAGSCWGIFPDVDCSAWYGDEVEYGYRLAILEPFSDGLFHPQGAVAHEDLFNAAIRSIGQRWAVTRRPWAEINATLENFADWREIDWYARPAYAYAIEQGLTVGYPGGILRPKAFTTRAEAAAVVNRILLDREGLESALLDGHDVVYRETVEMRASMYTPDEHDVGSITYTGVTVRHGAVAVDPDVIPLGTLLYVEGYGHAVAVDIGGMIKGDRIDLFSWRNAWDAMVYGIQPVKVWVLP